MVAIAHRDGPLPHTAAGWHQRVVAEFTMLTVSMAGCHSRPANLPNGPF
jgi:hypothetical protein